MKMKLLLVLCLFLVGLCGGAKLPSTFEKCDRKSNECLTKAVKDALHQLTTSKKEVGLPSFDPLEIPALSIGAGNGAVGLQQNYKNVKMYGFTNPEKCSFDMNDKNVITLDCTFPEIRLESDYDVNGKILLLPVYGNGQATITLKGLRGIHTFTLEEYEKKGKKYFKIVASTLDLQPQHVTFNFENLFNGDKALGDNINQVINDNWQEVFKDVKPNYEKAFDKIVDQIFGNLLKRVPESELFNQ